MLFFYKLSPPRNKDKLHLPLVPVEFIQIMRGTLAKMAGEGLVQPDFVGLDFWTGFPKKFNSKKDYEDSKEKEQNQLKRRHSITMNSAAKILPKKVIN